MPPTFNITVNNKHVPVDDHRLTGLQVKESAIAAGVEIEMDFQLSQRRGDGSFHVVGDDETVTLNKNSEFRAVGPDDNS